MSFKFNRPIYLRYKRSFITDIIIIRFVNILKLYLFTF